MLIPCLGLRRDVTLFRPHPGNEANDRVKIGRKCEEIQAVENLFKRQN